MQSTQNHFLFSFLDYTTDDMPVYVLLSKDYKKILIACEVCECFDDDEFDEDKRYGLYDYYFILDDRNVRCFRESVKQYTFDCTDLFTYGEFKTKENSFDELFINKVKKISKSKQ